MYNIIVRRESQMTIAKGERQGKPEGKGGADGGNDKGRDATFSHKRSPARELRAGGIQKPNGNSGD